MRVYEEEFGRSKELRIVSRQDNCVIAETDVYIASLLVDDTFRPGGQCLGLWGCGVERLRHGANTYSLFSSDGAWVLSGPSKSRLLDVLSAGGQEEAILGSATVQGQWRFRRDALPLVNERLAATVCNLIPSFMALSPGRQSEIRQELSQLCLDFACQSEAGEDTVSAERVCWDLTLGPIMLPAEANGTSISLSQVDGMDLVHGLAFGNLEYWWQSIFMIWWKGFW